MLIITKGSVAKRPFCLVTSYTAAAGRDTKIYCKSYENKPFLCRGAYFLVFLYDKYAKTNDAHIEVLAMYFYL